MTVWVVKSHSPFWVCKSKVFSNKKSAYGYYDAFLFYLRHHEPTLYDVETCKPLAATEVRIPKNGGEQFALVGEDGMQVIVSYEEVEVEE